MQRSSLNVNVNVCMYVIGFWCSGAMFASPGPILTSLVDQYNTDLATISWIFTARGAGYVVGALVAGYIKDHYLHIAFSSSILLECISAIILIYATNIVVLFILMFLIGSALNEIMASGTALALILYSDDKTKSRMIITILYCSFALGTFMSPLLIAFSDAITGGDYELAFFFMAVVSVPVALLLICKSSPQRIEQEFDINFTDTNATNNAYQLMTDDNTNQEDSLDDDTIEMGSGLDIQQNTAETAANSQLSNEKQQTMNDIKKEANAGLENTVKPYVYICTLFVVFFLSAHVGYGSYISTFFENYLNEPRHLGHFIASAYFGGFALGRVIGIYVSRIVDPLILLSCNVCGMLIASIVLWIDYHNTILIFFISIIYGICISTCFPSTINLAQQSIQSHYGFKMNSKETSMLLLGAAIGELVVPPIEGNILGHEGLQYFAACTFVITMCVCVSFVGVVVWSKKLLNS